LTAWEFTLKAPVELFERLDRWCLEVKERDGTVMAPSRPAAIRWIVHQFLLKQEARVAASRPKKRQTKLRQRGRAKRRVALRSPPPQP
jgi:hypothetical protein